MSNIVNHFRPNLEGFKAIYQSIHHDAELSNMETYTARLMANHVLSLGFAVTERLGGTGVVGVLRNGKGRCVMLRAEMDALPIKEATGLPCACDKTMQDSWGQGPAGDACRRPRSAHGKLVGGSDPPDKGRGALAGDPRGGRPIVEFLKSLILRIVPRVPLTNTTRTK